MQEIVEVYCRDLRGDWASSINAVLILSVGVTANILATIPADMPASKLRPGLSVPVSGSLKAFFILSKERNRTASFPMDPITRAEHPE